LRDAGSQLQIELRLRDVRDATVLWTQSYDDRAVSELPALEHEIAQAVAATLRLPFGAHAARHNELDPHIYREYLEARRLLVGPQRAHGLDLLRELTSKAPDYARAHATLARALTSNLRAGTGTNSDLDEAAREAARALELDPDLAETQTALAILACRAGDWGRCMDAFRRALVLDPSDAESRDSYAYWLAALGYVGRALHESESAWRSDPLSYNANFSYARLLDTAGRHLEATHYLDALSAESGGLVYAKWHNAVWQHDFKTAARLTAMMPRSDGFRESYIVVTEALAEPRLWPQVLPLISTSERANGGINVQRIMMPNPDHAIVLSGLEKMLRDGWPSYYMLLWMPEYAAMRRAPAFQEFLKRTRLLEYWRVNGWPPQCRAEGDGARCD
jgi:tetratricopeptide (TPR) repeat protein